MFSILFQMRVFPISLQDFIFCIVSGIFFDLSKNSTLAQLDQGLTNLYAILA